VFGNLSRREIDSLPYLQLVDAGMILLGKTNISVS
jgi:hypothetical protein